MHGREQVTDVMQWVAACTGLDEFTFFGAAPVDILSGWFDVEDVKDYDIAIEGRTEAQMASFEETITANGFDILKARRPFVIRGSETVYTTYAAKDDVVVDANFMRDPSMVGLYNVNSLYVTYPDLEMIDDHDALAGIDEGRLEPVVDLDAENGYLLAQRFLLVSTKYDIDIRTEPNESLAERLASQLRDSESPSGQFQEFLLAVLATTVEYDERAEYLRTLSETGLLASGVPEIERAYRSLDDDGATAALAAVEDVTDLTNVLVERMQGDDRRAFAAQLGPLTEREWVADQNRIVSERLTVDV